VTVFCFYSFMLYHIVLDLAQNHICAEYCDFRSSSLPFNETLNVSFEDQHVFKFKRGIYCNPQVLETILFFLSVPYFIVLFKIQKHHFKILLFTKTVNYVGNVFLQIVTSNYLQ
jgi:hypothetical protein